MRSSGCGSTGSPIFPASDVHEAVTRFEAGSLILLIGDGIAPPADLVAALAEEPEPAVATFPDDEAHEEFERIDGEARWAGVALVDAKSLGSTAAMLGDWDLQSTLLRRTLQEGALRVPIAPEGGEPILAAGPEQLDDFQRRPGRSLARHARRLGQPLRPPAGRGIRHRPADGNECPAGLADLGRT